MYEPAAAAPSEAKAVLCGLMYKNTHHELRGSASDVEGLAQVPPLLGPGEGRVVQRSCT